MAYQQRGFAHESALFYSTKIAPDDVVG
jgi:hypothetical protein